MELCSLDPSNKWRGSGSPKMYLRLPREGGCVCSAVWEKSWCICCSVTPRQSDLQWEAWDEYYFFVRESEGATVFESKIAGALPL